MAAEAARTAETHLRTFPLPPDWGIALYLKDESTHPSGSLKHRLARALLTDAIRSGNVSEGTTLVEASSGSTAVSEAYFARLLGLDFVAVVPAGTSAAKLRLIEEQGGRCVRVDDPNDVYAVAADLGARPDWYNLDQFGRAADVYAWDGEDSLIRSVLGQMRHEQHARPDWIVVGAGTGGTSAAIGRYLRHHGLSTKLAVVDPEGSVFHEAWRTGSRELSAPGSRIEGIGRPRVEPSFVPEVIDEMVRVPDAVSLAAMDLLRDRAGIDAGGSSGTNLAGGLALIARMRAAGRPGSVVTLVCDGGDRYVDTLRDHAWRRREGVETQEALAGLDAFLNGSASDPF